MVKKALMIICPILCISLLANAFLIYDGRLRYPKDIDMMVSDSETAIKIAEAVWINVYGEAVLEMAPFTAKFIEDEKAWYVGGTLPKDAVGGVPEILIRQKDGKIIMLNHGM